jgi:hypothetical protein
MSSSAHCPYRLAYMQAWSRLRRMIFGACAPAKPRVRCEEKVIDSALQRVRNARRQQRAHNIESPLVRRLITHSGNRRLWIQPEHRSRIDMRQSCAFAPSSPCADVVDPELLTTNLDLLHRPSQDHNAFLTSGYRRCRDGDIHAADGTRHS